ncbi:MAG TPA: glycosyltransferase family 2 protein, partial [Puia sp.]|nr:glycosyltransferase family 2 protein [Puia sp.]
MILSVIIVNYNVKYFLEQCLCSVQKAIEQLETPLSTDPVAEVIVVDNHSADGSPEYLQNRFSRVRFIFNPENLGYGRANNLGLKHASGRYILFLNPDTILAEDSLVKCLGFLESHPGSGAMGVRMIDGHGEFLRESMRGFPSPWVA